MLISLLSCFLSLALSLSLSWSLPFFSLHLSLSLSSLSINHCICISRIIKVASFSIHSCVSIHYFDTSANTQGKLCTSLLTLPVSGLSFPVSLSSSLSIRCDLCSVLEQWKATHSLPCRHFIFTHSNDILPLSLLLLSPENYDTRVAKTVRWMPQQSLSRGTSVSSLGCTFTPTTPRAREPLDRGYDLWDWILIKKKTCLASSLAPISVLVNRLIACPRVFITCSKHLELKIFSSPWDRWLSWFTFTSSHRITQREEESNEEEREEKEWVTRTLARFKYIKLLLHFR